MKTKFMGVMAALTAALALVFGVAIPGALPSLPAPTAQAQTTVEEVVDDERLRAALFEPAHIHQTGGDDLPGIDRGDPSHRHEYAAAARHLDDEADDPRSGALRAERHDDVPDATHGVAQGVEDGELGQSADEDAGARAHTDRLVGPTARPVA